MIFIYKSQEYQISEDKKFSDFLALIGKDPQNVLFFEVEEEKKFYHYTQPVSTIESHLPKVTIRLHESNTRIYEPIYHTGAHILAQAMHRVFPEVYEIFGPPTEQGFFQEIDLGVSSLNPEMFEKVQQEVYKIIEANYPVEYQEVTIEEAKKLFSWNPYKLHHLSLFPKGERITVYKQGEYMDLCRGPHVSFTGQVKDALLLNFASSVPKFVPEGREKNNFQRIYGRCFLTTDERKKYERFIEEGKKRDHRKVGKELDLFSFHQEGLGFPLWHPAGVEIIQELKKYLAEKNTQYSYETLQTPMVFSDVLWKKSGHYEHFKKNMYFVTMEDEDFAIKPMNCPGACLYYNSSPRSYKQLPLRVAEFGLCHRYEISGALHGLFRVRAFTQDDAHIFCTEDQVAQEVSSTIQYVREVYAQFGFDQIDVALSTRPESSIGSDQEWEFTTRVLKESLEKENIPFVIQEGEGAFYGPKIEFALTDSLNRKWQCGTIQLDLSMPRKLDVMYEGADNQSHYPFMIHRAVLGSIERFLAILLEDNYGKFPLWLAPVQCLFLHVNEEHINYLDEVASAFQQAGIRIKKDTRAETISYRIRMARNKRIPYIAVIGKKEEDQKIVTLTSVHHNMENKEMSLADAIDFFHRKIKTRDRGFDWDITL